MTYRPIPPPRGRQKGYFEVWLRMLVEAQGQVVTYEALLNAVGLPTDAESWRRSQQTLAALISQYRKHKYLKLLCSIRNRSRHGYYLVQAIPRYEGEPLRPGDRQDSDCWRSTG